MCAKASMEEFEALLKESFEIDTPEEGSVVKGKVIAIEAGQAIIDVGYKMEGRVDLKEFADLGGTADIKIGDEVEVYLMARPAERWRGVVQGVGWAIDLADGRDIPRTDLPRVDPTLDWVRLARRFPVRIILEDGPGVPIRMGETAAVIQVPVSQERVATAPKPVRRAG